MMDITEIIEHKEALIYDALEGALEEIKGISDKFEYYLCTWSPDEDRFDKLSIAQDKLRYPAYYIAVSMFYSADSVGDAVGDGPGYYTNLANYRARMAKGPATKSELLYQIADLTDKLSVLLSKYPDRLSSTRKRTQLISDSVKSLDEIEEKLYEIDF